MRQLSWQRRAFLWLARRPHALFPVIGIALLVGSRRVFRRVAPTRSLVRVHETAERLLRERSISILLQVPVKPLSGKLGAALELQSDSSEHERRHSSLGARRGRLQSLFNA